MTAFEAFDDRSGVPRSGDPVEHVRGRRARGAVGGRHIELDQRHEPPVRAPPFRVVLHAERPVGALPFEQAHDHRLTPRGAPGTCGIAAGEPPAYSHSIVPGGFDVMSNTTRLTPFVSLTSRLLIRARTS